MLSGWVVFLCEIEKKMRDLARKGLTAFGLVAGSPSAKDDIRLIPLSYKLFK